MSPAANKKTPYKKLSPAAKKIAKAAPGSRPKGKMGGSTGARSGRRPLG